MGLAVYMARGPEWAKLPVAGMLAEYQLLWHEWEEVGSCLKVATARGPLRLKRFAYPASEFPFVYALVQYLAQQGFPHPERIVPTSQGHSGIITTDGFFYLAHWQEGKAGFGLDEVPLTKIGELLGCLHGKSWGFQPAQPTHPARSQWGEWPSKLTRRYHDLVRFAELARQGDSPFDCLFAQQAAGFIYTAERVLGRLEQQACYYDIVNSDRKARYACHRDFIPRNLVCTSRGELALIDFDNAAYAERIDDIAKMLQWFAGWQLADAQDLVHGYERWFPLQDEEVLLVKIFLEFPMEYWQLGRHAYEGGRARLGALRAWVKASRGKDRFLDNLERVK